MECQVLTSLTEQNVESSVVYNLPKLKLIKKKIEILEIEKNINIYYIYICV